jgi:hypothetical protein
MRPRAPRLLSTIALATCMIGLLLAPAAPASTEAAGTASASASRGHDYPGAPKDTRRCRKLLRQIERARDQENYDRLNKLARRYNRTCRIKP